MDKFGIFELLDTLSALMLKDGEEADVSGEETSVPAPEAHSPSAQDKSFLPPDFFGASAPQGDTASSEEEGKGGTENGKENAVSSLYARHERISKNIDRKK